MNAIKNLFRKPLTVEYPAVELPVVKNRRGIIEYAEKECIYCLKCEKVCPPSSILFVETDTPTENPKNRKSLVYEYNPYLCIYCGECIRACPTPALSQSEKKPPTTTEKVNDNWFEIEKMK
jgi:NADH-quinone oxidoreductase subunit I